MVCDPRLGNSELLNECLSLLPCRAERKLALASIHTSTIWCRKAGITQEQSECHKSKDEGEDEAETGTQRHRNAHFDALQSSQKAQLSLFFAISAEIQCLTGSHPVRDAKVCDPRLCTTFRVSSVSESSRAGSRESRHRSICVTSLWEGLTGLTNFTMYIIVIF